MKILLIILLLLPLTVTADNFTWILPDKQINGTALPPTAILKSTMYCGTNKGGPYGITKDAPGAVTLLNADFVLSGEGFRYCVVTTTGNTCAAGVNCESDPSGELSFFLKAGAVVINHMAPAAPGTLKLVK